MGGVVKDEQTGLAFYTDGDKAYLRDAHGIVAVPAALAARYVAEQGLVPASPDEVQNRQRLAEQETVGGQVKTGAKALALGLYTGATAIGRAPTLAAEGVIGATAGEESVPDWLKTFNEETSGTKLQENLAGIATELTGQGFAEAGSRRYKEATQAQFEANPGIATSGRVLGEIAGGLGISGAAAKVGARAAGAIAAENIVARKAAELGTAGLIEGGLMGTAQEHDDAYLAGRAVDQEKILANMGIGALFGGAAGGALGAATGGVQKLRRVFGKADDAATGASKLAEDGFDDIDGRTLAEQAEKHLGEPVAPTFGDDFKDTLSGVQKQLNSLDDATKAELRGQFDGLAGLAPEQKAARQIEIADQLKAKFREQGVKLDAADWSADDMSGFQKWLNRDTIIDGAAGDVTKKLDDVVRAQKAISEELVNLPTKNGHVRANLADLGEEGHRAAIDAAKLKAQGLREKLGALADADQFGKFKRAKELESWAAKLEAKVADADDAADVYTAIDDVRRKLQKEASSQALSAQRVTQADQIAGAQARAAHMKSAYLELADFLSDGQIWGKQGAAQKAVNSQFVELINANKFSLKDFVSQVGTDIDQRGIYQANGDKVRSYMESLGSGQSNWSDQQFRRVLRSHKEFAQAVRSAYDLPAAKAAELDSLIGSVDAIEQTLGKADNVVKSANQMDRQLQAMNSLGLSTMQRAIVGGVTGGTQGAMFAALGGQTAVLRQLAESTDSRVAKTIAGFFERAAGSGKVADPLGRLTRKLSGAKTSEAVGEVVNREEQAARSRMLAGAFRKALKGATSAATAVERNIPQERGARQELHRDRMDQLASVITNPAIGAETVQRAYGPMTQGAPLTGAKLSERAMQIARALYERLPASRKPSLMPKVDQGGVSDQDLRRAEALWSAAQDPLSIFDDLRSGELDYDKVEFVREQFPELMQEATLTAMDHLRELDEPLPTAAATQLELLLNFNGALEPSLAPQFLAAQIERAAIRKKTSEADAPSPPRNAPRIAEGRQTLSQKVGV